MKARRKNVVPPLINSSTQSPPLLKIPPRPYFQSSLHLIQNTSCYQNGKINIDGGYGDYRMSIFRRKDRIQRETQSPSIITPQFIMSCHRELPAERILDFDKIICTKQEEEKPDPLPQKQEPKVSLPQWNNEQDEHLLCQNISHHQRRNWFSSFELQKKKVQVNQNPEQTNLMLLNMTKQAQEMNTKNRKSIKNRSVFMFRFMDRKKGQKCEQNGKERKVNSSLDLGLEQRQKIRQTSRV